MMVTFTLKDKEALVCDSLDNFDFSLNFDKEEVEVYKKGEFLGYYRDVVGTTEEDLFQYITTVWKQNSKE